MYLWCDRISYLSLHKESEIETIYRCSAGSGASGSDSIRLSREGDTIQHRAMEEKNRDTGISAGDLLRGGAFHDSGT